MFGKNEIVGQKYFKDAEDKLFVTSMFMTLQGEGPYRGEPAFFVRFTKCNLACSFCDTWFDSGDWYTIDQLENKIENEIDKYYAGFAPVWASWHPNVRKRQMVLVITGGEPMLQKNIVHFLVQMNRQFKHTQIESNGLIFQPIPKETTLVVSPKCNEKNGKPTHYLGPNKDVLAMASCLKFVMSADLVSPYSSIPSWALEWHEITEKPIYISPMNIYNKEPDRKPTTGNQTTIEQRSAEEVISFWTPGLLDMEQNQKNHEYAAKYCVQHGLTLNLQVHLFASLA